MIKLIIKQMHEINKLKLRIEELEEMQKNEIYKKLISKFDETDTIKRLKAENKRLREKLKEINKRWEYIFIIIMVNNMK